MWKTKQAYSVNAHIFKKAKTKKAHIFNMYFTELNFILSTK